MFGWKSPVRALQANTLWKGRWRLQSALVGAAIYGGSLAAFALSGAWVPAATGFGLDFAIFTLYSGALAWALFRSGSRDARLADASARLIERLPAGVALVGRSNTIEYANDAFLGLVGSSSRELLGCRVEDVPAMAGLIGLAGRARRAGLETAWVERVRISQRGGPRFETFAGALRLKPARPEEGFFLFVQEATETLRLRHESRRHRNVSEFLMDTVTHELSNSLQVVQGLSEMADLEACKVQCQGRMPCQTASSAARRASGIVADVKRLALLERLEEQTRPASMHALILEAVEGAARPAHVRIRTKEPAWARQAGIEAGPLASFGLSKLIEEAAARAGPAAPEVELAVLEPLWGSRAERLTVEVRVTEAHAVNGAPQGRVNAPGRTGAPDLHARTPLRLALAAAVFEQQGWQLISTRTEGEAPQAVFQLSVPLMARPPPAAASAQPRGPPAGAAAGPVRPEPAPAPAGVGQARFPAR